MCTSATAQISLPVGLLVLLSVLMLTAAPSSALDIRIYRDISNCVPGHLVASGPATAYSSQGSNVCAAPLGEGKPAYKLACVAGNVVKTAFNKSDCSDGGVVALEVPADVCTHFPEGNSSAFYDCSAGMSGIRRGAPNDARGLLCNIILLVVMISLANPARGIEVHFYKDNDQCTGMMTVRETIPSHVCKAVKPERQDPEGDGNAVKGEMFRCQGGRVWVTEYEDEECNIKSPSQPDFSLEADRCTAFGCTDSSDRTTCNTGESSKYGWVDGSSVIYDCSSAIQHAPMIVAAVTVLSVMIGNLLV